MINHSPRVEGHDEGHGADVPAWASELSHLLAQTRERVRHLLFEGRPSSLTEEQLRAVRAFDDRAQALLTVLEGAVRDDAAEDEDRARPGELEPVPFRPRVLVAEDDEEMLCFLEELLEERYDVTPAVDGADALRKLSQATFDLAVVDLGLPRVDGFRLAEEIRASFGAKAPAFMFLSAHASPEAKVKGLSLGAADYVTKPFDPHELLARVRRIIMAAERESSLRADALTDPLTGLSNYRSLMQSLQRELERARRYDQPLSLITIDLDNLKQINDCEGHAAGNDAIDTVAQVLASAVRSFETVARQGGDEFAVLLPSTTAVEAVRLAERLRGEVAAHTCHGRPLSISAGVASRERGQSMDVRTLVDASDRALYRAKRQGRDRVCLT